ncbi:MAG TPA: type II toxin-antitoxin system VapC family toxin [Trueperaceae bacterium]|jgi:ribonuclease VapC|nr:type II toxin-antitoxin system VapC family toxin [Trueperaceae bacterium]
MMVVDTSALVAILAGEPEHDAFNEKIATAEKCSLSAANYVETHIVIESRFGDAGTRELALYLHESEMSIVPVDRDQADLARLAYRDFGRGKHEAQLNFGDCFAYALAKRLGAPLLFKGGDFSKTDVMVA